MTYWLIVYIGFACPGGWFSSLIPAAARPVACKAKPEQEFYSSRKLADKRVLDIGPSSATRLFECKAFRCREKDVDWTPTVEIEE